MPPDPSFLPEPLALQQRPPVGALLLSVARGRARSPSPSSTVEPRAGRVTAPGLASRSLVLPPPTLLPSGPRGSAGKLAHRVVPLPPLPSGALAPSTAAPATSACAVLTTTASGSTTAWARGTTGESGTRPHVCLGLRGSECEPRTLSLHMGWGRGGVLRGPVAGVH